MNKYQEALEELAMYAGTNDMVDLDEYAFVAGYEAKLQELVDRATPMKIEEPLRLEQGLCGECPHCTAFVQSRNYCGHCGQKLDWSEE